MNQAEQIINRIKSGEIRPKPKWQFTAKRIGAWSACSFAILFGAIAFSVILFVIQEAEYDLLNRAGNSRLQLILALMPLIWVAFLVIFLMLSIFGFRYAPRGYKYTFRKIFGISSISSIVLGVFIFLVGGGQFIERAFASSVDVYKGVNQRKMEIWSQPGDGFLSGTISLVQPEKLRIEDFSGKAWTIDYADAFVAGRVQLVNGERIKIIGEQGEANTFYANEVRPWQGKGKGIRQVRQEGPHQPQQRRRGRD